MAKAADRGSAAFARKVGPWLARAVLVTSRTGPRTGRHRRADIRSAGRDRGCRSRTDSRADLRVEPSVESEPASVCHRIRHLAALRTDRRTARRRLPWAAPVRTRRRGSPRAGLRRRVQRATRREQPTSLLRPPSFGASLRPPWLGDRILRADAQERLNASRIRANGASMRGAAAVTGAESRPPSGSARAQSFPASRHFAQIRFASAPATRTDSSGVMRPCEA
jgi:hypothetical protein